MASGAVSRFVSFMASRGKQVRVVAVETCSLRVRRIRLQGPALEGVAWNPGDKVKLHVPPGVLRSYTPSGGDRAAGTLDVVVHLHGQGPAASWAASATEGEKIGLLGPKPSLRTTAGSGSLRPLFLGDETALGLMCALVDGLSAAARPFGAVEVAAEDVDAVAALDLPLTAVPRVGNHGEATRAWLRDADLEGVDGGWLSGEVDAVAAWVDDVVARHVPRQAIRAKAYWSVRGHDHRKRVERSAGLRG
ncbi:MAG: siderophore-interacting protein [Myxococcota bacterium]